MATYGRQVLAETGRPVQVLAHLDRAEWVVGGITIDWSLINAVTGSDVTYIDGTIVKVGQKGIPFGTILCAVGVQEVQTITIDATGGTFTISGNGNETSDLAYNAAATVVQAAIRDLGGDYSDVTVTLDTLVYTITFPLDVGNVAELTTDPANLTGGAGTAAVATSTAGTTGNYGPFDSAATDGRASLERGACVVLNESVLETPDGYATAATDHPGVFDGGTVWKARLRVGGDNPVTLGTGSEPTWAAFEAAFPRVRYAQ